MDRKQLNKENSQLRDMIKSADEMVAWARDNAEEQVLWRWIDRRAALIEAMERII